MKKVESIGIGGRGFVIDKDGYDRLQFYLKKFREKIDTPSEREQVMMELEERIAELFSASLPLENSVVTLELVNQVIKQLGLPDGSFLNENSYEEERKEREWEQLPPRSKRRLFRDGERKKIGGVASGLAYFFDIDVTIIRVLFLAALIGGGAGFWIYIVLWIVVPKAVSATDKCEMRGIPPTAENLNRYRWRR